MASSHSRWRHSAGRSAVPCQRPALEVRAASSSDAKARKMPVSAKTWPRRTISAAKNPAIDQASVKKGKQGLYPKVDYIMKAEIKGNCEQIQSAAGEISKEDWVMGTPLQNPDA